MPFIITDGTTLAKADRSFNALRACLYPCEATVWDYAVLTSGALTGVAASNSTGTVFSLRQLDTSLLLVRRIGIEWVTTTGFTGAQYLDFGISVARSFSGSDSGGTPWASTSNNSKLRTSLAAPASIDLRIAGTSALGAGTRTIDGNCIAQAGCNNAAGTAGAVLPMTYLLDQGPGDYPLILAQNEGLIIWPQTAMGTGGVGQLRVAIEFAQAASY